jgi:hypothetical protein
LDSLERLREEAGKCAEASLWRMSDTDLAVAVQQVHRLEQTVAAVKRHLIAEVAGRDLPDRENVRDTVTWVRLRLLLDGAAARRLVEQATALVQYPVVDAALCEGRVSVGQAAAIIDALDALPTTADMAAVPTESADESGWSADPGDGVTCSAEPGDGVGWPADAARRMDWAGAADAAAGGGDGLAHSAGDIIAAAEVAAAAETALLGFAADFAPGPLRRLGARILDHVAPQVAERLEAKALERAERRAWPQRGFSMSPSAGGLVRVGGHLTVEDAAIVSAALDPLSGPGTDADSRTPAQLRADALVEVCRLALRTADLPDNGGEPPQLAVTVAYDLLTGQLRTGRLDSGDRVSPTVVRRLACDARLVPMVLGGAGQVLDAGRSRRLATGPLRRALVTRDRGCAFPDCDRPPRWCDGHHLRPWTAGGGTDMANLVMLCRRHHRLIHERDWTVRMAADGLPEFLPPPVFGVPQRARRNRYHRRT